jgi:mannose-6-phosphate isomerase-like protein (cupin superfamily)
MVKSRHAPHENLDLKKEIDAEMVWSENIEKATIENRFWRKVLHTSRSLQVVLMSVPVRQELGWEKHGGRESTDQFFRVEQGRGVLQVGRKKGQVDEEIDLYDGVAAVVPGGKWHNVINESSRRRLNFYTIYAPPHHPRDRLDRTKSDESRRERKKRKK